MKRMLLFTLLAALPLLIIASPPSRAISGKWFNPHYQQTVKIKQRGRTIKVKGLTYRNRWSTFDQVGRRTFEDYVGTVIRIIDRNRILVKNRYHRSRKVFIKHDRRGEYCNRGCSMNHNHNYFDDLGHYDSYGNGFHYDDSFDGHFGSYGNGNDNEGYGNHGSYGNDDSINLRDLDGTYKVRNSHKRIIIVNTRDGFKAKYRGKGNKWVKYDQQRSNRYKFRNRNGDIFTMQSDGSLKWKKRKGNKSIRFIKISDNTFE